MLRVLIAGLLGLGFCFPGLAQEAVQPAVLFRNVQVFDGLHEELSAPCDVLVSGNQISRIGPGPLVTGDHAATVIEGGGRVLMPGLIDNHAHIMFASIPMNVALSGDIGFVHVASTREAHATLKRGFTTIRDMGGPCFGLKAAIDQGLVTGPRIFPSGAFVSQTGGHGDFRIPNDLPAKPGDYTHSERSGAAAIADSPDAGDAF